MVCLATLWISQPPATAPGQATAIITKIPAPSATFPVELPTSVAAATLTPVDDPPAIPGSITVGTFVQIAGTGGDGLRLRIEPNINAEIRFLGQESEVFEVRDGPTAADSYTWWYLVAPFDESRNGWAVAPYLVIIENPQVEE